MIIVGITHPICWNPAACLIKDGELLAFAEEERFTREKHAPHRIPIKALEFCIKESKVKKEEIKIVAIGFQVFEDLGEEYYGPWFEDPIKGAEIFKEHQEELDRYLISNNFPKVKYYPHHLCHAVSATLFAPFSETNIITLDGWGGDCSGLFGFSKNSYIEPYGTINNDASWGGLYRDVTSALGFRAHSGEGKTMGLACYGEPDEELFPRFFDDTEGKNHPSLMLPSLRTYEPLIKRWSKTEERWKRIKKAPTSKDGRNLAATLQNYYEQSLVRIAKHCHDLSGCKNFALAGGVALNCSANGKLAQQEFVENMFVQPASHDAGSALGAAILAYEEEKGEWPKSKPYTPYLGPKTKEEEIYRQLVMSNLPFQRVDPALTLAELIHKDCVVGWFQGRAETGPRALGNRSIFANATKRENLKRVNLIKERESWRPLAPAIAEEDFRDIVESEIYSPYMLMAFQVKENWKEKIPAVVHVDGSCRPQSVSETQNEMLHTGLKRYEKLSGVPVFLNTSFNLKHEPIVNSPKDAISTFLNSDMNALIIGDFLVAKELFLG